MTTLLALATMLQAATPADSAVRISIRPARPVVVHGQGVNHLNFDFVIDNAGPELREIKRVTLTVLDRAGRMVHRQFLSAGGAAEPALLTVPKRSIPAGGSLAVFNPFYVMPSDLPLDRLRFEFAFETRGIEPVRVASVEVAPWAHRPATRLTLPLDGPALVYDGHDFYSHHRRIPLDAEFAKRAGLTSNPVRYANDWTPVGPDGALSRGSLESVREWYGYGAKVRAPAAGVVVSAANDVPDNRVEKGELVLPEDSPKDLMRAALGNHLIIRHREGEYSVLAHLRAGSVAPVVGDTVKRGQVVGEIGFSGDTGFHVHLHQMLITEPTFSAEGLPSYFDGVQRVAVGSGATPLGPVLNRVHLDTGDLVSRARPVH